MTRMCCLALLMILMASCTHGPTVAGSPLGGDPPRPDGIRLEVDTERTAMASAKVGRYKVDAIDGKSIRFNRVSGHVYNLVDTEAVYRASFPTGNSYYFQFCAKSFTDSASLESVVWADDRYPAETGYVTIERVEASIRHKGHYRVTMVGDSLMANGTLRRKLAAANAHFCFTGSLKDAYGYGHEAISGNSTADVLQRVGSIPASDIYLVHIGTNDRCCEAETVRNIQSIVARLLARSPDARVFVLTIIPRDDEYERHNRAVNDMLRQWVQGGGERRVTLLDTEAELLKVDQWYDTLNDGLHPNDAGYGLWAGIINRLLVGSL